MYMSSVRMGFALKDDASLTASSSFSRCFSSTLSLVALPLTSVRRLKGIATVLPSFLADERSRVFLVEEKVGVWAILPLLLALLLVLSLGEMGVVRFLHTEDAVDLLDETEELEQTDELSSSSLFLEVALLAAFLVGVGLAALASDLKEKLRGSVRPRGRVLGTPTSPWLDITLWFTARALKGFWGRSERERVN